MSNTILVTGATGTVGSEVVKQLSQQGIQFRVLVRSQEKAEAVAGPGVAAVLGDFGQPETLQAAMEGIERLFLLTPPDPRMVEWHRNAIAAAKEAGVRHIVKLSVISPTLGHDNPVALGRWHKEAEEAIEGSGLAWTHLRPHGFMQNTFMFAQSIQAEGRFYSPISQGSWSQVDARDVAAVAVAVLTGDGHEGKAYDITGPEAVSMADVAAAIGAAIGKEVNFVPVPYEAAHQGMLDAGMPEWFANDIVALDKIFDSGDADEVTDVVTAVAGKTPITFDQFAQDYAAVFK